MTEQDIRDDLEKISQLLKDQKGIRIFNQQEVETLIDMMKHKDSYMELINIHMKNPKALEAWVWLYDTAARFRSVGDFFMGTVKYVVLLGASAMIFVDKPLEVIKTAVTNIFSVFGGS